MTLAIVHSRACVGVDAPPVTVEVHISNGMPALTLVGLPETTVKEARDRVRSAIVNANFEFPSRRITVNLAPADLPKEGGRFDLPIALGILAASEQIPADNLQNYEFLGELAVSGGLRPVKGSLPAALAAKRAGRCLIVPDHNGEQVAWWEKISINQRRTYWLFVASCVVSASLNCMFVANWKEPWSRIQLAVICKISLASNRASGHSRLLPQEGITYCFLALPVPARRCWLPGCVICCRR